MTYKAQRKVLHYNDANANSHKFYNVYVVMDEEAKDYRAVFHYGRIGTRGRNMCVQCSSYTDAFDEITRKVMEKRKKGYTDVGKMVELPHVPVDVLAMAGVNLRSEVRTGYENVQLDPLVTISREADEAIRLLTGTADSTAKVVVIARGLHEQLETLRAKVLEAEGQIEVVDMLLQVAVG